MGSLFQETSQFKKKFFDSCCLPSPKNGPAQFYSSSGGNCTRLQVLVPRVDFPNYIYPVSSISQALISRLSAIGMLSLLKGVSRIRNIDARDINVVGIDGFGIIAFGIKTLCLFPDRYNPELLISWAAISRMHARDHLYQVP